MGAASAQIGSAPRITRHLPFVIPAAAERRSPPEFAGRGAFGNIIGEPTTDHAARYYKFESGLLQRRSQERTVPRDDVESNALTPILSGSRELLPAEVSPS